MKMTLCVNTHDGNDSIDAQVELPCVPQIGATLAMWQDGIPSRLGYHEAEHFPIVEDVIMSTYWPDDIKVYLRFESFDLEEIRRVMDCAQRKVSP